MVCAKRAVFLDRDGVINIEKGYVHRIADFEFTPGAPLAIRLLKDAGFLVIVVTNQSGIARGFYSMEDVQTLHRHLDDQLSRFGTHIDAYYVCPHHPVHGMGDLRIECSCRKPLPGMINDAAADFSIDLHASYLIGDNLSDIEAGRAAGCRSFLVRTGYGEDHCGKIPDGVIIFSNLLEAARHIAGEGAGVGDSPSCDGPVSS